MHAVALELRILPTEKTVVVIKPDMLFHFSFAPIAPANIHGLFLHQEHWQARKINCCGPGEYVASNLFRITASCANLVQLRSHEYISDQPFLRVAIPLQ